VIGGRNRNNQGRLVGGFITVAIRFGSGFTIFFFGFLTSRRRASLFPMVDSLPQFASDSQQFAIEQSPLQSRLAEHAG